MQRLLGELLRRLDPVGADEALDTHADLNSHDSRLRSSVDLCALVARAARRKLGLSPGAAAAEVLEAANVATVLLAAFVSAGLFAGEVLPSNRTLWRGDASLPGAFVTTGPPLYVGLMLLAVCLVAGYARVVRVMAYGVLTLGIALVAFSSTTPWSRPPLFILVPLLCAALVSAGVPPGVHLKRRGAAGIAGLASGLALTAVLGAFAFRDRLCGICMYRGLGPLELLGTVVPPVVIVASIAAAWVGIARGRAVQHVAAVLVVLAPWTLFSLRLIDFDTPRVVWSIALLALLAVSPVLLSRVPFAGRSTVAGLVFVLVVGGLAARVGLSAFSGPIPGASLELTPTLGNVCVERRGAADITWSETLVNPAQSIVVQSVHVDSSTGLAIRDAMFVPLRDTRNGITLLGITRSFPPTKEDLARATSVDWAHRLPAEGAHLQSGRQYLLTLELRLNGPTVPAALSAATVAYEARGQRAEQTVATRLVLPSEGAVCGAQF